MTSKRPRGRKGGGEGRPPVHPLLTFQFDSDAGPQPPPQKARRRTRTEPPSSIADAIARWLEQQL